MSLYQNVISIVTSLLPSKPTAANARVALTMSTFNGALVDAGSGIFADRLGPPQDDATNGLYVFDTDECTGLDIAIVLTAAAQGLAGTFRVMLAVCLNPKAAPEDQHWHFHHLYDGTCTSSAQTGVANGVFGTGVRWATLAQVADGGLLPLGTRIMTGTTLNAASRLIADPVCWPRLCIQIARGANTSACALSGKWTRS